MKRSSFSRTGGVFRGARGVEDEVLDRPGGGAGAVGHLVEGHNLHGKTLGVDSPGRAAREAVEDFRRGHHAVMRFGEMQRAIPQATAKMLTQQLKELEADGIISRKINPVVPPKT
ncbi:MAG: helix-turn-helix transcriptional regulator [Victivallales bacterium]|nr:helix-turn-helix transcriptional regulator [Victivallales bacterium]